MLYVSTLQMLNWYALRNATNGPTSITRFIFYFNRKDYKYEMAPAEYVIHSDSDVLGWNGCQISFAMTLGYSHGSMCIYIDGMLFTGDTIMPYKPYFNGRDSNEDDWKSSIEKVLATYPANTLVYPGHGEVLTLGEWSIASYT